MSMKTFVQHLLETEKTYEFRIKLANIDPTDSMEKLENALEAYGLDSISKPKRLPIKESDIDFPNIQNCQLYLMDAVLKYPCNDAQLRAIISERAGIPQANIVVVPKNHPEEIWRWNIDGASEIREYKKGEAVLDKPLEDNPDGKAAGLAYSGAAAFLKDLTKVKFEIAGKEEADGKTTNDLAVGTDSPIKGK